VEGIEALAGEAETGGRDGVEVREEVEVEFGGEGGDGCLN